MQGVEKGPNAALEATRRADARQTSHEQAQIQSAGVHRVVSVVGGEPGALVMTFDKHTGEEPWRALAPRTEMGYSQTTVIKAGGARQLIVWQGSGLCSLDPDTGALYREEPFPGGRRRLPTPFTVVRTCSCRGSAPAR